MKKNSKQLEVIVYASGAFEESSVLQAEAY